ncbi:hypothetical protein F4859DRAFT_514917 [Xylaria cf. heliscus]|nr:hypothetical protein F4859DRAFT_514917 [Xylaria cf. heliscus]
MEAKAVYLLALVYLWELAAASFYHTFDDVTQHTDMLLQWDHANAADYPLVIHARVLNKTNDLEVNTIEADVATGLTNDSFLWRDLPFPLPFLPTAMYELWVLRQPPAGDAMPGLVVASSPPFTILSQDEDDNNDWQTTANETATDSPEPTHSSHWNGRPNSSTAIAAGLVVPFVVGISITAFLCMQRRQKRIREERRKERAGLVID